MKHLVLTLGSSPLPVVVAALALKGTDEMTVHLIYTQDVTKLADRVLKLLVDKGIAKGQLACVNDHSNVPEVQGELGARLGSALRWAETDLHYTGITKQMAVHTHAFWAAHRQAMGAAQPAAASYLTASGKLAFDDGGARSLTNEPKLSLQELCELHFGATPKKLGDEHLNHKKCAAATAIHAYVAKNGFDAYSRQLPPIYGPREVDVQIPGNGVATIHLGDSHAANEDNFKNGAAFALWPMSDVCTLVGAVGGTNIDDVCEHFRGDDFTRARSRDRPCSRKSDATWLFGDWLEVWLASVLKEAKSGEQPLFDEVHQDVEAENKDHGDVFQADVVAIRAYRVHLFSCTTESAPPKAKLKLFEAMHRARRLGGDHARVALVCLAKDPLKLARLARAEGWTGYDEIRVFGRDHVLGKQAPCFITKDGKPGSDQTLLEGLWDWVGS